MKNTLYLSVAFCLFLFSTRIMYTQEYKNIEKVGEIYNTFGNALSFAVQDNYAYIAGDSGLRVVDISNPQNPVEINRWTGNPHLSDVFVSDKYAYVINGGRLHIIDISDPGNLKEMTVLDYLRGFRHKSIFVSDRLIYLTNGGQLHLIFMTSDHMVLHPCDSYKLTGALDVHPHENYIYVAGLRGLYVFEIENPGYLSMKLKRTSGFATSGSAKAIYILNNYAFLGGTKGLYILNVSDINKIVEVGFYKTKHSIKDVFVWNDLAFIAETSMVAPDNNGNIRRYSGGLRVINISDPSNPQLAGFYDLPGNPGSEEYGKVYYDGKYVYMTDGSTFSIYKHISPDSN